MPKNKVCVLLVDDDVDDIAMFGEILLSNYPNAIFKSAFDGTDAINMLDADPVVRPDIIFLDLNMPRMDGKECLRILKSDDEFKDIPVFIYTTSTQSRDIEETMVSGAACFITKPTHTHELKEIIVASIESIGKDINNMVNSLSRSAAGYIVC